MKSSEVYALLRSELAPVLKSLGFKREKAFLSWSRKHDAHWTVVWCQVSLNGWDAYAGSQFVVEFQRSAKSEVGDWPFKRTRISGLLSDAQRAELQVLQNAVISSLGRAPANHPALLDSPEVSKWYLAQFIPISAPYTDASDVWLRYATPAHVKAWALWLGRVIPQCVESIEGEG